MSLQKNKLPGDFLRDELTERIIRVNHAGEYGAKRIYQGQLSVLGKKPAGDVIRHMAEQEEKHLAAFDELVATRKIRPTVLMPLWHIAGFALGAATALMGEKAAMACTVAVEEVIDEHYKNQEEILDSGEQDLKNKISEFRAEEIEHKKIAIENEAEKAPAYEALSLAIKAGSRLAIWLSSRI